MSFSSFKRFLLEDDGLFFEFLPYSSIGSFWIPEGTIYEDVYRRLPLPRLSGIASLVALTYMPDNFSPKNPGRVYYLPFSHSRLDHSLCVGKGMEVVFQNNGFGQGEVDKAAFTGLIHDIATPALGDAAIGVDYARLNEEDNWWDAVMPGFAYFSDKYKIREGEVDLALHSKGVLGGVLDVVDKIVYVTKDLYAMLGPLLNGAGSKWAFDGLEKLIFRQPFIGDALLDIRVGGNGDVYSENPERLGKLLLSRAVLHKRVYLNPFSQGRDFLLAKMIASLYSPAAPTPERPLTPEVLRQMTDSALLSELGKHFDIPWHSQSLEGLFGFWQPQYKRFGSRGDAEKYASRLSLQKSAAVLGVKEIRGFNPASSLLVQNKGEVMPFCEYDWAAAEKLERLAGSRAGFYVFYDCLKGDDLVGSILGKLSV